MNFTVDKQTADDLNLLGKFKNKSVYGIFNRVKTKGGEKLLQEMFQQLLADPAAINRRSETLQYFHQNRFLLDFDMESFAAAEELISSGGGGSWFRSAGQGFRRQILHLSGLNEEYNQAVKGLKATIEIVGQFKRLFLTYNQDNSNHPLYEGIQAFLRLEIPDDSNDVYFSMARIIKFDYLLKEIYYNELKDFINLVHHLDLYVAISDVARENSFSYAAAVSGDQQILKISNCKYPGLKNAIGNDVNLHESSNVLFLTGANMAGKSTFMKAIGVTCYLAHMGFPVPADSMTFSVKHGMYSSINVADNLATGHSHYYAEVMRVKQVALDVSQSRNLIVVFDELFKGTNVKDAYDATLAVTDAFAVNRNCFFIISTHIIEVGQELQKDHAHIQFSYLPTIMNGNVPKYTYKLEEGITNDRHGMMIIENEGILELLIN